MKSLVFRFLTTSRCALTILAIGGFLTLGCSSPGSSSRYKSAHVGYTGPGYGGGDALDIKQYASGVPVTAGSNTQQWYEETRP